MNIGRERNAWEGKERENSQVLQDRGSERRRERERERTVSLTECKGDVELGDG